MWLIVFAMGFAAVYRSSEIQELWSIDDSQQMKEETVQEIPVDTLPHVKVKKTDNPTNEPQVESSLDLVDPENLNFDVGEYD